MSTVSITDTQQQIIEDFAFFDNWEDRYRYLIDLGKKLPPYPDHWRGETYRVHGCQAQVWFHSECRDNLIHIDATSDAAIVSGLIYILLSIYSNRTPNEIIQTPPTFVKAIGFDQFISPTRANGLAHMLTAIKQIASSHLTEASHV